MTLAAARVVVSSAVVPAGAARRRSPVVRSHPATATEVVPFDDAGRIAGGHAVGGDVFGDHAPGADLHPFADVYACDHHRIGADVGFAADDHLAHHERLDIGVARGVGIAVVEAGHEDVLPQPGAFAHPDGPDHHRSDTHAGTGADQDVACAVVQHGELLHERPASHLEAVPREQIVARAAAAHDGAAAFLVDERIDEPADPQPGPRILMRADEPDQEMLEAGILFDFFEHAACFDPSWRGPGRNIVQI